MKKVAVAVEYLGKLYYGSYETKKKDLLSYDYIKNSNGECLPKNRIKGYCYNHKKDVIIHLEDNKEGVIEIRGRYQNGDALFQKVYVKINIEDDIYVGELHIRIDQEGMHLLNDGMLFNDNGDKIFLEPSQFKLSFDKTFTLNYNGKTYIGEATFFNLTKAEREKYLVADYDVNH